jgi:hypothetical protein
MITRKVITNCPEYKSQHILFFADNAVFSAI